MKELEKLDKTITTLGLQAQQLKEFNKVFAAVKELSESVSKSENTLSEFIEKYYKLEQDIEGHLKNLSSKSDELYSDQKKFFKELDDSLASRLDRQKSDLQLEIRNEINQLQKFFENALESKIRSLEEKSRKRHVTLVVLVIITLLGCTASVLMNFI